MTGGHELGTELVGEDREPTELEMRVAGDTRIGCLAGEIRGDEWRDDLGLEVGFHVEDQMPYAEASSHPPGIRDVLE
jgi:hypothetical protein